MRRGLLALVLMLAAAQAAGARDPLAVLDGCIGRLDPQLDVGFEKVAARCPELAPALRASPWGAWLPSDWDKPQNNLSAQGLRQLRELIARETGRRAPAAGPRVADVAAVLAQVRSSQAADRSWWTRFKEWLRVAQRPQARPDDGWLSRLLARLALSRAGRDTLTGVSLALLALLTAAIVLNELRNAGLLRTRRAGALREPQPAARTAAGWPDIEQAPAAQRPRLLLELIAARLAAQDRLPPARALTVRELLEAARLTDAADRQRLAELAAASERLRFSDRLLPAEVLSSALRSGRELLVALDTVPA
jgi:hypothetical protein